MLLAPKPGTAAAVAVKNELDDFERAVEHARRFLAKNDFSPAVMFSEIIELFKKARLEQAGTAKTVDALVVAYEEEEELGDHAEDYCVEVSAFILDFMIGHGYLDKEKGWTEKCPDALKAGFLRIEKSTIELRAHIAQTMTVAEDGDEDDPDPDEPTQPSAPSPAPAAPTDPAVPTEPAAPAPGEEADDDADDDDDDGLLEDEDEAADE